MSNLLSLPENIKFTKIETTYVIKKVTTNVLSVKVTDMKNESPIVENIYCIPNNPKGIPIINPMVVNHKFCVKSNFLSLPQVDRFERRTRKEDIK